MKGIEVGFGLLGLGLIAVGSALHPFVGTAAVAMLLLPAGTLLAGGVACLQASGRRRSARTAVGLAAIVSGVTTLAVLAYLTPAAFLRPGVGGAIAFGPPDWGVLLGYHLAWSVAAVVVGLGLSASARAPVDRCLAVGLVAFSLFPATAGLCWFVGLLAT